MTKNKTSILATAASLLALLTSPVSAQTFNAQSAGDFGGAHQNYPASNTIDGNTAFASRWAANFNDAGGETNLFLDFGSIQRIDDIGVAWGRGNTLTYNFEVRARSGTSGSWTKIRDRGDSSGSTTDVEQYNVTDFDARQVRIKVFSNSSNTSWTNVTEFEAYGSNGPNGGNNGGSNNAGDYTFCANERGTCSLPGAATVRYGANGQYNEQSFNGGNVPCTNAQFGDPIRGTAKTCEYQLDESTEPPTPTGDFTFCANERGTCSLPGAANVRYGANGQYNEQSFNGGNVPCTNAQFGDPIRGTAKTCEYQLDDSIEPPTGEFGLDPSADPWDNFDLSHWKLDTPASRSNSESCKTQVTEPQDWQNNFPSQSAEFFFTHSDGGMRFVTDIGGATTGGSCDSRTRSELREMLRGSNTSIDTDGKDGGDYRNNWALGYQPTNHAGNSGESWGAREGEMRATLRVNQVTTSGKDSSKGRVVIGQIHAKDDEPLRLNYKHRAGFQGGCIYASSEKNGGDDTNFILAGSDTSCSSDPGNNGLGLGELFSYQIENRDEDIIVTIYKGDFESVIDNVVIDLNVIDGGYDVNDDWMYFKAGAYTQNSLGDDGNSGDSDIVTFYRLDVTH